MWIEAAIGITVALVFWFLVLKPWLGLPYPEDEED